MTFFLLTRLVRFAFAVPLTAFVLHFAQPELPWQSWLGVAALSLVFIWCVDGVSAFVRRRKQLRAEWVGCKAERR